MLGDEPLSMRYTLATIDGLFGAPPSPSQKIHQPADQPREKSQSEHARTFLMCLDDQPTLVRAVGSHTAGPVPSQGFSVPEWGPAPVPEAMPLTCRHRSHTATMSQHPPRLRRSPPGRMEGR